MGRRKVPVWGFDEEAIEEAIRSWPSDLEPEPVTTLPREGTVVVYGRAARRFQEEAERHRREDGRLPEAILYLRPGEEAPPQAWAYFDAVVTEGEWDVLRDLVACPRRFEMAEMAEELPADFLQALDRPIEDVPISHLPLPEEVRRHLKECKSCQEAFYAAVWERIRLRREILCPDVDRLAAYARGEADPQVERHLETCRVCRAQVAVLQDVLASSPLWLTIALPPISQERLAQAARAVQEQMANWVSKGEEILREVAEILARLVEGAEEAGLTLAGAWTRAPGAQGALTEEELAALMREAAKERGVFLLGPRHDLTVRWDPQGQSLWLGNLHGSGRRSVTAFTVEIRRGSHVLWSGRSEGGWAAVPLAAVRKALAQGADRLVIRVAEGEAGRD